MNIDQEKFFEFINALRDERHAVIVVEGSKDRKALRSWGVSLPIELFHGPLLSFVEAISSKYNNKTDVILLLDADPTGRELTKQLYTEFERLKHHVNLRYWKHMQVFGITFVEGLLSTKLKELYERYLELQV
ncbi:MAG: toprim domain-containing protein [Candidatus Heimdallarchaeaceae archaeon]